MAPKRRKDGTSVPWGDDTRILGYLTSVGGEAPPSVERLLTRLRIFYFFFLSPVVLIAGALAGIVASGVLRAILGDGSGSSAVAIVAFVLGGAGAVVLLNRLFSRLTRRYRGGLIARSRRQAAWAREQDDRRAHPEPTYSLAELDARLAPPSEGPGSRG